MDVLMGHFVYICIFMHLVDVQARMQLLTSYRMARMVMRRTWHNMMQRQSGDGRYREQEKCGK
jgi:hypothetical protein